MPVGHQHGVAGEVKEIAFIFHFFYNAEKQLCEGLFFFSWVFTATLFPCCPPLFHVSCPRLAGLWLCLGSGVGEAAHVDHLPHSMFPSPKTGNGEHCVPAEHGLGTRYNLQVIVIFKYQQELFLL